MRILRSLYLFSCVGQGLTGPWVSKEAIGVNVYKYGVLLDPLFWTLALTVMFGCASLYLMVVPRHSL